MNSACGIDFGTSNSTLSFPYANGPALLTLEDNSSTVPSAIFFGHEPQDRFLIGRAAVSAYVDGAPGRLMRSLKSILGKPLINEQTPIFGRKITFANVIASYLQEIKTRAERQLQSHVEKVVMGRPVQFVDNDEAANAFAEKTLYDIAASIGFKHISFQYEPVTAALEFERQLNGEKLALIADIGGGTSDFSAVRLGGNRRNRDRKADVLANSGVRVGGTDFDRALSMAQFMPSFGLHSPQKRGDLEMPQPHIGISPPGQPSTICMSRSS